MLSIIEDAVLSVSTVQSKIEAGPHRAMVGGFLHAADVIVDTGVHQALAQGGRYQHQVDAQTAPGFALESPAAIVEPTEAVVGLGVNCAVGVEESPVGEGREPFPFFRQEAALARAQPALGVVGADADIEIQGRHVHVAEDYQVLIRSKAFAEEGGQVGVELAFGGKLDRMLAALALGEVAVDYGELSPIREGITARDEPALGIRVAFFGQAPDDLHRRLPAHQGDAVMGFLAEVVGGIAQGLDRLVGKGVVGHLGFLETDDVRVVPGLQRLQLMWSGADAVDVEGNDFHGLAGLHDFIGFFAPHLPAMAVGLAPGQGLMVRDRVLSIRFEGARDMARVSQVMEGMDHAVCIAPVVPELGIVGAIQEAPRVFVEVADQFQELG